MIQRWHLGVRDGINWYRSCMEGAVVVPGKGPKESTRLILPKLQEDPPWPHLVVELNRFWQDYGFWGDRPGGSRWHRLLPAAAVELTGGWRPVDSERAREFIQSEVHLDLLSRPVLWGSCHLMAPNPVYRRLSRRKCDDDKSIELHLELYSGARFEGLELVSWNQRARGATSIHRIALQPGLNVLCIDEGVEEVGTAVCCPKRGLLEQSKPSPFIRQVELILGFVTERRHVEGPNGDYTVDVADDERRSLVGTSRSPGAVARLAADEVEQGVKQAWESTSFQWFYKDTTAGKQAIRGIIGSGRDGVDLIDPYFGKSDLREFALATTRSGLPVRILTSASFCVGTDAASRIEHGEALFEALESVKAQDPRFDIEVKVMKGGSLRFTTGSLL